MDHNQSLSQINPHKESLPPIKKGIFILFEGIDGCGKTSLSKRLWMDLGIYFPVNWSCEPTRSPYGQRLRESFASKRLAPREECELFVKDRGHHVHTLIQPCLDQHEIIILDRYDFSTLAYQGPQGIGLDDIVQMNAAFPHPDLTFVLDVSLELGLERIMESRGAINSMETQETQKKARDIFLTYPYPNKVVLENEGPYITVYEKILQHTFYSILCPMLCTDFRESNHDCLNNQNCLLSKIYSQILSRADRNPFHTQVNPVKRIYTAPPSTHTYDPSNRTGA
jgi:dTMP kinase